jgi:hypothetical protein
MPQTLGRLGEEVLGEMPGAVIGAQAAQAKPKVSYNQTDLLPCAGDS